MRHFPLALALLLACDTAAPDPLLLRAEVATERAHQGFVDDETRAVVGLLEARAATGSPAERIAAHHHAADVHLAVADTLLPHDRPPSDTDYARSMASSFEVTAWRHRERAIHALEQARLLGSDDADRTAQLAALEADHAAWTASHQRAAAPVLARLDRIEAGLDACDDPALDELYGTLDLARKHVQAGDWQGIDQLEVLLGYLEQRGC